MVATGSILAQLLALALIVSVFISKKHVADVSPHQLSYCKTGLLSNSNRLISLIISGRCQRAEDFGLKDNKQQAGEKTTSHRE